MEHEVHDKLTRLIEEANLVTDMLVESFVVLSLLDMGDEVLDSKFGHFDKG